MALKLAGVCVEQKRKRPSVRRRDVLPHCSFQAHRRSSNFRLCACSCSQAAIMRKRIARAAGLSAIHLICSCVWISHLSLPSPLSSYALRRSTDRIRGRRAESGCTGTLHHTRPLSTTQLPARLVHPHHEEDIHKRRQFRVFRSLPHFPQQLITIRPFRIRSL